jgi:uncharacterized membrane protein YoaK (UPF0700 family)
MLAAALSALDGAAAFHFAAVIGSFILGTVISGFIIQDSALNLGHRYGIALFLESLLLGIAVPLLDCHNIFGIYSAACACGLQNAMMSTYSGAVVRTTHISGMFTDLGIFLGHAMRGIPIDFKRLRLCFLIISGFLCGGIAGGIAFHHLGYSALFIPCSLTAITSVAYEIYRICNRKK